MSKATAVRKKITFRATIIQGLDSGGWISRRHKLRGRPPLRRIRGHIAAPHIWLVRWHRLEGRGQSHGRGSVAWFGDSETVCVCPRRSVHRDTASSYTRANYTNIPSSMDGSTAVYSPSRSWSVSISEFIGSDRFQLRPLLQRAPLFYNNKHLLDLIVGPRRCAGFCELCEQCLVDTLMVLWLIKCVWRIVDGLERGPGELLDGSERAEWHLQRNGNR